jgi:hypothetical protein
VNRARVADAVIVAVVLAGVCVVLARIPFAPAALFAVLP